MADPDLRLLDEDPGPAGHAAPARAGRTAIVGVYGALRERILGGCLAPGSRLHVENLRREYGVSTSTMREALSRLLIDALVTFEEQRGFRVAGLSRRDFRSLTDARKLVEGRAAVLSVARRSDAWEAELLAAHHRLARIEERMMGPGAAEAPDLIDPWEAANTRFHDCIARNCDNDWLARFRRTLHHHSARYIRLTLTDRTARRDTRAEHRAILDAALEGDGARCAAAVEAHIEAGHAAIAARLPPD